MLVVRVDEKKKKDNNKDTSKTNWEPSYYGAI